MARLAADKIALTVCPLSNLKLRIVPDLRQHNLARLLRAGLCVTLNSDDPPFFHTSLAKEYEVASSVMGFSDAEILGMTRTAIEAAFVDEPTRQRLLLRL